MNKNIKYIISILLVIPIALWFLLRSDSSTLTEKETGFAVSDTSTITKIFIADKKSNQVTLKRTNKGWVINNKFDSNPKLVEGLLGSMQRLKVKAPVPIVARDNVIKRLASIGVKVEVYETSYRINISEKLRFFPYEKLAKVYYVGDATQDNLGTYMLLEGAEHPYITHIPGFRGFLSTRYSPKPDDWKSHILFDYNLTDIKSVAVQFGQLSEESFKVDIDDKTGNYNLINLSTKQRVVNYDTLKLLNFLTSFSDLRYETRLNNIMPTIKLDSIVNSSPIYEITLVDENKDTTYLKGFYKKALSEETRQAAYFELIPYDNDRFYASVNDGEDFVLLQYYIFDVVLYPLSYYTN
ncbi:MAG: hypothetical protein HN336_08015 [Lentimicrobiaceae bacterium]|jgi:hypothetical protein|nr:hypothetical protein [Lentimicrobiaceae bacterium]MCP4909808.1 hypothetical protein [Bacteroidota bacterium]MBT3454105.1 hypothetical protein [Lentimicrobiaceae bacterium]MBT3819361.1 hypothetical protein [Lentimicrobiaceae bacterium]MBT4060492.1 hypothetical protein [Lentimicrobiaceae bacterium]